MMFNMIKSHSFCLDENHACCKFSFPIDQEPTYLIRQFCVLRVLQWEEIKTKNSGATQRIIFEGKGPKG